MKLAILSFVLSVCLFQNGTSAIPPSDFNTNPTKEAKYQADQIFFNDSENDLLYIDFEPIVEILNEVRLYQGDELMMVDRVIDLPGSTIYELNTGILRSGDYTIELVTLDGIQIHKRLQVQ